MMGLPSEVAQVILLRKDERILFAIRAGYRADTHESWTDFWPPSPHRYFVLSNRRMMILDGNKKSHSIVHTIELERVRTTSVNIHRFGKSITLSIGWQADDGAMKRMEATWSDKQKPQPEEVKNRVDGWIRNRVEEIEKDKKRERIQYVIDFSFLKAQIEKGGVVLSTVKCPNCAAAANLPDFGDTIKCGYCGAMIRAMDVFEKLKGLIGT